MAALEVVWTDTELTRAPPQIENWHFQRADLKKNILTPLAGVIKRVT